MPKSWHRHILAAGLMGLWVMPAQAANLTGEAVVLRALDKVTAMTQDFVVPVGDTLTYNALRVEVKHCETHPPEEVPETYAFLQVFEMGKKNDEKKNSKAKEIRDDGRIFSGWMLSSKPAVSALEHPVYDVWVIGCKVKPSEL